MGVTKDKDGYLELVGPHETEATRAAMLTMSGCALTVLGFWRLAQVKAQILATEYRIGQAMADVLAIAKGLSAWRTEGLPGLGDAVVVGAEAGGHEHVYTVTSSAPAYRASFDSIDGGQLDEYGAQFIRAHTRKLYDRQGKLWDTNDLGLTRVVLGWVDIEALKAA